VKNCLYMKLEGVIWYDLMFCRAFVRGNRSRKLFRSEVFCCFFSLYSFFNFQFCDVTWEVSVLLMCVAAYLNILMCHVYVFPLSVSISSLLPCYRCQWQGVTIDMLQVNSYAVPLILHTIFGHQLGYIK
jgi:hypothetical protein